MSEIYDQYFRGRILSLHVYIYISDDGESYIVPKFFMKTPTGNLRLSLFFETQIESMFGITMKQMPFSIDGDKTYQLIDDDLDDAIITFSANTMQINNSSGRRMHGICFDKNLGNHPIFCFVDRVIVLPFSKKTQETIVLNEE